MGSITVSIEGHNNVFGCRVYGARQPKEGRSATPEELNNIHEWIRSSQLVEEFLDGSNGTNDTTNRIIIDLIHGQPIRITPLGQDKIHLVDGGGAVRILKQTELRTFLDSL